MNIETTKMEGLKVVAEIGDSLKLYSDGSFKRFPHPTTPASSQFTDGMASKDVVINSETGVWARIFRPETASPKSPLIIYFHGSGFCAASTAWSEFHVFLSRLCKTAGAVIVSVDYRLAPEHRLPAAYDDCTEAVEWVRKQAAGKADAPEEWLSPAVVDFSRSFLAGESAGANIVHHVGLRVADMDTEPLIIRGLVALHPFFGGERAVDSEKAAEYSEQASFYELLWNLSLPAGSNTDHPFCNPAVSTIQRGFPLAAVLVAVGGKDYLKERGVMYYEYLRSCGKEAELMEEESGVHGYHLALPQCEATSRLIQKVCDFVSNH